MNNSCNHNELDINYDIFDIASDIVSVPKKRTTNMKNKKRIKNSFVSNYNKTLSNSFDNTYNNSKFHIIIDTYTGNYTLLDQNMNVVDTLHKNYIWHILIGKHLLKKFKKILKKDFRLYKKECRHKKIHIDKNLKSINKYIKYYLSLCPDADYYILELLRRNTTKVNPSYGNYQTACAQYLHELAVDIPHPERMPFDLFYICNDLIYSNHRAIATPLARSNNPIENFKKKYLQSFNNSCSATQHIDVPVKHNFIIAKHIKAPISYDER